MRLIYGRYQLPGRSDVFFFGGSFNIHFSNFLKNVLGSYNISTAGGLLKELNHVLMRLDV